MKKALTASIQFILVLVLVSCSSSDSTLKGDPITVSWVPDDGYYDEETYWDYCPFEYNDIYYKEIPVADGGRDYRYVEPLEVWGVDTNKMGMWGKMKVRKSNSAYLPQELAFLYGYLQAFAYFEDYENPLFIYCFNHLWCRKEIELSAPRDCVAAGYELLEVKSGNTLNPQTMSCGKIEKTCCVKDVVDYRTQHERSLEYDFHQHYYKLRFVNPDYSFLYAEMEIIKLDADTWYWVYQVSDDLEIDTGKYGRCIITAMSEPWQNILNQYEKR